jgi:hypothetical protein
LFPDQSYYSHTQTQAEQLLALVCLESGPQEQQAAGQGDEKHLLQKWAQKNADRRTLVVNIVEPLFSCIKVCPRPC